MTSVGRPPQEWRELFVVEPVIVPIRAALEGIRYEGRSALDDFAAAVYESWGQLWLDVEDVREVAPGTVLATGVMHAVGRESGAETETRIGWVAEVEEGRISTLQTFPSEAEALAAVDS
jgi:hypothetical protein